VEKMKALVFGSLNIEASSIAVSRMGAMESMPFAREVF
jgi:hypothetical protein